MTFDGDNLDDLFDGRTVEDLNWDYITAARAATDAETSIRLLRSAGLGTIADQVEAELPRLWAERKTTERAWRDATYRSEQGAAK